LLLSQANPNPPEFAQHFEWAITECSAVGAVCNGRRFLVRSSDGTLISIDGYKLGTVSQRRGRRSVQMMGD